MTNSLNDQNKSYSPEEDNFDINELCDRLNNRGINYHMYGLVFGTGHKEIEIEMMDSELYQTIKSDLTPIQSIERLEITFQEPIINIKGIMKPWNPTEQ